MARVTEAQVKAVADGLGAKTITAPIDAAHAHLDALVTGLSEAQLTQIELYLAAHYAVLGTPTAHLTGTGAGGVSISASGEFGRGLDATLYGQMAKRLDTSGKLAEQDRAMNGNAAAGATVAAFEVV